MKVDETPASTVDHQRHHHHHPHLGSVVVAAAAAAVGPSITHVRPHPYTVCLEPLHDDATLGNLSCQGKDESL